MMFSRDYRNYGVSFSALSYYRHLNVDSALSSWNFCSELELPQR